MPSTLRTPLLTSFLHFWATGASTTSCTRRSSRSDQRDIPSTAQYKKSRSIEMNRTLALLMALLAVLFSATIARAINDALWEGFVYSVAVKYLDIVEQNVDTPHPKSMQMPDFPMEAMEAKISGDASVSFLVTEDGSVRDVVVEKALIPEFGESAKAAVLKWKFRPGTLLEDSKKIARAHMRCRFEFRVSERR